MGEETEKAPVVPSGKQSKSTGVDIKGYFEQLQSRCADVLALSLRNQNSSSLAKSHQFGSELTIWVEVLGRRRESYLVKVAAVEYEFALLALSQGHYRHAFKGLRLVLELCLQAVNLGSNELLLREWLDNRVDTVWASLVDNDNGVLSKRFAKSFFPQLEDRAPHFCGLARMVYRECSESVHGRVDLPEALVFAQDVFDVWHSKADLVAFIAHFTFAMRYLNDMEDSDVSRMEVFLNDRIGSLPEIRRVLGGPVTA